MYLEKKEEVDCQYIWDLTSPNNIGHNIPRFKFLFQQENQINWIIKTHKKTPMHFMKLWKEVIYQAYQTYADTEIQDQLYWAIIDTLNNLPTVKNEHEEKYRRYAYSMIIKGNHYSDEVFADIKQRFKQDWLTGSFCHYYRSSQVKSEDIKELLESSKNHPFRKFSFRNLLYNSNYISEEDLKYILDYCQYKTNNKIDLNLIIQCPNVNFNILKMYLDVSSELNLLISASSWKKLAKLTKQMSETQILYLLNQAPQLANYGVSNNPINLSIELLE